MHWLTITIFCWRCARNMIPMPAAVQASTIRTSLRLICASNSRHDCRSFDAEVFYSLSEASEEPTKTKRVYRGRCEVHEISARSKTQLRTGSRQAGILFNPGGL